MAFPRLPFERNPTTGELFIRLNHHPRIIVTPPRISDAAPLIELLNDERVCVWLSAPPYPYKPEHADWWLNQKITETNEGLEELEKGAPILKASPVQTLREIQDDGSDIFLGTIDFFRCPWMAVDPRAAEGSDPEALLKENNARPVGDPDILWTAGYYLSPSHHGQGIISDALGTLLHKFAVPLLGVRRMIGSAYTGNKGSIRVFEKNGFVYRGVYKEIVEAKGKKWDHEVLDWSTK
ncbi:hypothetical protein BDZ89DRAFT_139458 [Hymenopellis radicata]|nr:hypothetical protein BDZ89DRAFT_139458 [Hymenopellis radicata]